MRAVVENVAQLAKALGFAAKVSRSNANIPILECARIEVAGDRLTLATTNLDREHRVTIDVAGAVPGTAVASALRLGGLASALPADARVTLALEGNALVVRGSRGHWQLPTLPEADFPAPFAVDADAIRFTLPADDARLLCDRLYYAASSEKTRYYLNGINIQSRDGKLACAATDGHKLSRITLDVDVRRDLNIIVPLPMIETLKALAGAGDVEAAIDSAKISFAVGPWRTTSKLIDGTYPDYTRAVPLASKNRVAISSAELLAAVRRLGSVGDTAKTTAVGLSWNGAPWLEVCLPRAEGNEETIDASVSGAGFVAAQADFLIETIEALGSKTVWLDYGEPGNPIIFTMPDDPLAGLALVSPMSVPQWNRKSEEPPPAKTTDVRKFKAKTRAGARARTPEPEDAA